MLVMIFKIPVWLFGMVFANESVLSEPSADATHQLNYGDHLITSKNRTIVFYFPARKNGAAFTPEEVGTNYSEISATSDPQMFDLQILFEKGKIAKYK